MSNILAEPSSGVAARTAGVSGQTPAAAPSVLLVDDNLIERRLTGTLLEKSKSFTVLYGVNGVDALAQIERQAPDVVLTDLVMPEMNGLELVEAICCHFPLVPVILMTAHGNEEIAIQALQKGAAGYVPKRSLTEEIVGTLQQVVAAAKASRAQRQVLECLTRLESHYELENNRALLRPLVTHIQQDLNQLNWYDDTVRTRLGIALEEAILNAMYHGNLELDPEVRRSSRAAYEQQAEQRRRQHPYADRRVHISTCLTRAQAVYTIRDEGQGFDRSRLPNPVDPTNLSKLCGRGLLLIRTFMDEVRFNQAGNEISLIKHHEAVNG